MNPIRCILIDDEPEAIDRLVNLLNQCAKITVQAAETDPEHAVARIAQLSPDLVFTDVEMPGKTGFDIVQDVRRSGVDPKFIFVTGYNQYAIRAIRAAAFDFLLKPVDIDELKAMLERFRVARKKTNSRGPSSVFIEKHSLTEREIEIIKLLAQYKSSKEIAAILFLSIHTVNTHRRNILEKTGKGSTAELVISLSS